FIQVYLAFADLSHPETIALLRRQCILDAVVLSERSKPCNRAVENFHSKIVRVLATVCYNFALVWIGLRENVEEEEVNETYEHVHAGRMIIAFALTGIELDRKFPRTEKQVLACNQKFGFKTQER